MSGRKRQGKGCLWCTAKEKRGLCSRTIKFIKKTLQKVCSIKKSSLPLHRYPENNLFTLKELIPIEDRSDWL
jgi:hypothetical protein